MKLKHICNIPPDSFNNSSTIGFFLLNKRESVLLLSKNSLKLTKQYEVAGLLGQNAHTYKHLLTQSYGYLLKYILK